MKKYIFQDGGESPTAVIVEKGEIIKNQDDSIVKITNKAPSHDDKVLITNNGKKSVKKREAGVLLEGVKEVLSASQEQIASGKRKDKLKDDIISISPEESMEIAKEFNISLIVKKEISPSKLFTLIKDEKDKFLTKLDKKVAEPENKYQENSNKSNFSLASVLPTDLELFDRVFKQQEDSKKESGVDFSQKEDAQHGGRLAKYMQSGGYTIKKGDTLNELSKKLGVSTKELVLLNNIKDINKIKEGAILKTIAQEPVVEAEHLNAPKITRTLDSFKKPMLSDRAYTKPLNKLDNNSNYGSLYNLTEDDYKGLDKFSKDILNKELVSKGYLKKGDKNEKEAFLQYKKRNEIVKNWKEPEALLANTVRRVIPLPLNASQMLANLVAPDNTMVMNSNSITKGQREELGKAIGNATERNKSNSGGTQYEDYSEKIVDQLHRGNLTTEQLVKDSFFDDKFNVATTLGRGLYLKDPETGDKYFNDNYDFSKSRFKIEKKDNIGQAIYKNVRNYLGETQKNNSPLVKIKIKRDKDKFLKDDYKKFIGE